MIEVADVIKSIEKNTGKSLSLPYSHFNLEKSSIDSVWLTFSDSAIEVEGIKELEKEDLESAEDYDFVIHVFKHQDYKEHTVVCCKNLQEYLVLDFLLSCHLDEENLVDFAMYFKGKRISYFLLCELETNQGWCLTLNSSGYLQDGVVKDRYALDQLDDLVFSNYNFYVVKDFDDVVAVGKVGDYAKSYDDLKIIEFGVQGVIEAVCYTDDINDITSIGFFETVEEVNACIVLTNQKHPNLKFGAVVETHIFRCSIEKEEILWESDLGKCLEHTMSWFRQDT